jgi:hypothetical protein
MELTYDTDWNRVTSFNQVEIYQLLSFMGNMFVFTTITLSIVATTYYSDKTFIINLWDQLN